MPYHPAPRRGSLFDQLFQTLDSMSSPWATTQEMVRPAMPHRGNTTMQANVSKVDDKLQYELALPGFKEEEVALTVDNSVLTVTATHEEDTEPTEERYYLREHRYTTLSRSFELPKSAQVEAATAHLEAGVLTISFPLGEEPKTAHSIPLTAKAPEEAPQKDKPVEDAPAPEEKDQEEKEAPQEDQKETPEALED